jgi:hypothetical protein
MISLQELYGYKASYEVEVEEIDNQIAELNAKRTLSLAKVKVVEDMICGEISKQTEPTDVETDTEVETDTTELDGTL